MFFMKEVHQLRWPYGRRSPVNTILTLPTELPVSNYREE